MLDRLLVVFSNYNGMRVCNDLLEPRIKVTLDSFKSQVPNACDINALLLDNNSNDGSDKLLKSYATQKWTFHKKTKEDFYLGTLYYLLKDCVGKYDYLMVVDNDHFFRRSNFLESAISILDQNPDLINFQIHEPTVGDAIDHHRVNKMIVGIYDLVQKHENDIWCRSAKFTRQEKFITKANKERGLGIVNVPGLPPKRICWLSFAASNTIMRVREMLEVFKNKKLNPDLFPYKKNAERLALFASEVYLKGRTGCLANGASFNIGFRKHVPKTFSVKDMIQTCSSETYRSLYVRDKYSYFLKNSKLESIEKRIGQLC